jgi:hypothetical protein
MALDFDILNRRGAIEGVAGLYIEYPTVTSTGLAGTWRALITGVYTATTFLAETAKGSTWSVETHEEASHALWKATFAPLADGSKVRAVAVRLTAQDMERLARATIPSVIYAAEKTLRESEAGV